MALTPDQLAGAQARVYRQLVANAKRDLRLIVGQIQGASPTAARNVLLEVMPALTDRYGTAAASAAAEWYDDLRISAGVEGRFSPLLESADVDAVERATRRAAGTLWTGDTAATLLSLDAILDLHIKRAGRDTMTGATLMDPRAQGWRREARGDTCGFCLMLASRGAVYRQATAKFASHHDCDCVAVPSWDPNAPEVKARQYVVSTRTAGMTPEQRAIHNDRARSWIDEFERTGALT